MGEIKSKHNFCSSKGFGDDGTIMLSGVFKNLDIF
jgi:hypothetical protein